MVIPQLKDIRDMEKHDINRHIIWFIQIVSHYTDVGNEEIKRFDSVMLTGFTSFG